MIGMDRLLLPLARRVAAERHQGPTQQWNTTTCRPMWRSGQRASQADDRRRVGGDCVDKRGLWRRLVHAGIASAARDEHVFPAVVGQWLPGEATLQCLQLQPADIEQAEPLVLRCPPQGALTLVVEQDVDAVVAHRVANRVRDGLVLVVAVQAGVRDTNGTSIGRSTRTRGC